MFLKILVGLLLSTNSAWATWHSLGDSRGETSPKIEIVSSNAVSTVVKVTLAGFESREIAINGQNYVQLEVPGFSLLEETGFPELPRKNLNFMVPATTIGVQLHVDRTATQEFKLGMIAPSKGAITRAKNPDEVPFIFSRFYVTANTFPADVVVVSQPFTFRDTKGVNVGVRPFQFDSSTGILTVTREIQFSIIHSSLRAPRLYMNSDLNIDQDFARLYRNVYLNSGNIEQDFVPVKRRMTDTGRMLIIYRDELYCGLSEFIKWKTRKGLEVVALPMSRIGADYRAVKSAIADDYVKRQTTYVLLVGDAEYVPFHPGASGKAFLAEADPLYGAIIGNDDYPEAIVSRFSATDCDGVNTQISKSLSYESKPDTKGAWYSRGANIASFQGSPPDRERAEWLKKIMTNSYYNVVDSFYEPSAGKTALINALNDGRGFLNYIGHGSETSWVTTRFSNDDIGLLENSNKLPFIVSVACVNGAFAGSKETLAERWMLAGTPRSPRGAVAIYASSIDQSWVPPTVGQYEINRLLSKAEMTTVGMLFVHGGVAVLEDGSTSANEVFETWHIFGDASMQVRTTIPTQINAQISQNMVASEPGVYQLKVNESGITAALSINGRLLGAGYSDQTGMTKISLKNLEPGETKATLTLTGFNKIPSTTEVVLK